LPESIPKDNTPSGGAAGRWRWVAAGTALLALALVMYRPWVPRPFDTLDFSEFLPLLTGADGPVDRFAALTRYYIGEHARLNLASYAALAFKWSAFGGNVALWQWSRFLQMLLLVASVGLVLRKLRVGPLGAFAGAGLFVVAKVAGEAWTRLTMGEPLGILAILAALWLSIGWRTSPHADRRALLVALLSGIAVLAKEMVAGMLPFVWLIALTTDGDGRFTAPRLDAPARRWLLLATGLPILLFGAAALLALHGGSQSFTSIYGDSGGGAGRFLRLLARPWLLQGTRIEAEALVLPANTLFALLLLLGIRVGTADPERRPAFLWAGTGAIGLSFALAVLYAPWPYFNFYYGLPFLLGPALLLGLGVDALAARGGKAGWAAGIAATAMLLASAPSTAHTAAFNLALQQVNGEAVTTFARFPKAERIVLASRDMVHLAWAGTAPTLRRYALATGAADTLPAAVDLPCPEVGELLSRGATGIVYLTYHHACGPFPATTARFGRTFTYGYITWAGGGIERDSVVLDLLYLGP
jgi:hypothetical protein